MWVFNVQGAQSEFFCCYRLMSPCALLCPLVFMGACVHMEFLVPYYYAQGVATPSDKTGSRTSSPYAKYQEICTAQGGRDAHLVFGLETCSYCCY
jgi:hypothetical protein